MRMLWIALITLIVGAPAEGQTANVDAKADFAWGVPAMGSLTGQPPYTLPLTGGDALTKIQAWVSTSPIPDNPTAAPIDLSATAIKYTYTVTIPNGSTIYGRFRGCTANACGALSPAVSKAVSIVIPGIPTGVSVTVTVTVSSTP